MASIGTNSFLRLCGNIRTTLMRRLEALGVIHPQRTDGGRGHRAFTLRDVHAARTWIARQGGRK